MSDITALDSKLEKRLLHNKLVSEDQLSLVRQLQQESPMDLAQALVELDILSSGEITHIVQLLHDVRSVKLEDVQIDPEAVKHIPRRVAIENRCIPVRRSGNTLVVAVSNLDMENTQKSLRSVTDFDIVLLMAEHDALEHALFIYYGDSDSEKQTSLISLTTSQNISSPWSLKPIWRQTFDTLVDHEGISRAREIAKMVASVDQETFNSPIMYIGPSTSGKTHLLSAIMNYCTGRDPQMRGILCEGDQLRQRVVDSMIADQLAGLRYDLRECSLLLIDDFELAWGNNAIERELAKNLSILIKGGAVVVVSINSESHLQGPQSLELREVLSHGTEVPMFLPSIDGMKDILSHRSAKARTILESNEWAQRADNQISWKSVQDVALRTYE